MVDFQNWNDAFDLLHLPTKGALFTWKNGIEGNRFTQRRLDRPICNQSWLDLCSSTSCSSLIRTKSDHYPLLLDFKTVDIPFSSNFKFLKMWALHPDCEDFIANCWQTRVIGCPMFVLTKKLKLLKENLRTWNREVFGNAHQFVREAEQNLHNIQNQLQTVTPTDSLLILEKAAQCELDKALERQECFWQEKAKVSWHLEGDRNTAFFHRITKIKNKTKLIATMRDGENLITERQDISDHVVSYFKNLFCTNPILQDQSLVEEVIPNLVGENVNVMLTMLPTMMK